MSKRAPESVVVHRVELQQKERELLESFTTSYAIRNWTAPIVGVMSSPTGMIAVIALFIAWLSRYLPPDWIEQTEGKTLEEILDWLETQNIVVGGIFALIGGLIGGPFGAALGGILGGAVVEGGEAFAENPPDWADPETAQQNRETLARTQTAFVIAAAHTMISLRNSLQGMVE